MTIKLRNVSGSDLLVLGQVVEVDAIVEVEGKVQAKDSPDDAYLVVDGDTQHLFPHAHWSTEKEK